jgi:hypothetical protein
MWWYIGFLLSDVVARRRLRATKQHINIATRAAKSKRIEAETCVIQFIKHALQGQHSTISHHERDPEEVRESIRSTARIRSSTPSSARRTPSTPTRDIM